MAVDGRHNISGSPEVYAAIQEAKGQIVLFSIGLY